MSHLNLSRSIQSCLLLTLLTISSCNSQPKITKKSISEIMSGIDKALERKDISAVVANISNTAKIEIEDAASGKSMVFTKETYQKYSEEGLKVTSDYGASRTDAQITIASDGESATLRDRVFETATVNGNFISTSTAESATFGLENGKVMITAIKGSITVNRGWKVE